MAVTFYDTEDLWIAMFLNKIELFTLKFFFLHYYKIGSNRKRHMYFTCMQHGTPQTLIVFAILHAGSVNFGTFVRIVHPSEIIFIVTVFCILIVYIHIFKIHNIEI